MPAIITQIGEFVAGDSGFPVYMQLDNYPQTNFFTSVTQILMTLTKPDGSQVVDRNLALPAAIDNVNGRLVWIVQSGDFKNAEGDPLIGIYTVLFSVTFSTPALLKFGGDFRVTAT